MLFRYTKLTSGITSTSNLIKEPVDSWHQETGQTRIDDGLPCDMYYCQVLYYVGYKTFKKVTKGLKV